MKKTLLLLAVVCSFSFAVAQEQTTQRTKPKGTHAEMLANRYAKNLSSTLALSEEQSKKTYDAMLIRFNEIQAIRDQNASANDKATLHQLAKPARQKFVQTMNSILTADQKTKWEAQRSQNNQPNVNMGNMPKSATPKANTDTNNLADDNDGMDD